MITIIALYIILGIIAFIVILLHFSVKVKLEAKTGEKPVIEIKWLFITIFPRKKKDKKEKDDAPPEEEYKSEFSDEDIEKLLADAEKLDADEPQEKELSVSESTVTQQTDTEEPENVPEPEAISEASKEQEDKKEKKKKKKDKKKKDTSEPSDTEEAEGEAEEKKEGAIAKVKRYFAMIKPYIPMAWKYFKKLLKTIRITKLDIELTSGKEDAYEAAMMYGKLNAAVYNVIALLSRIFTVRVMKNTKVNCRFDEKVFEYDVSTVVMVRPSALIAIVFCIGINFLRIFIREKFRAWRKRKREEKENKKLEKQKIKETELLENER